LFIAFFQNKISSADDIFTGIIPISMGMVPASQKQADKNKKDPLK
jgi:hypothetical protein